MFPSHLSVCICVHLWFSIYRKLAHDTCRTRGLPLMVVYSTMRHFLPLVFLFILMDAQAQVRIGARAGWSLSKQHLPPPAEDMFQLYPALFTYDDLAFTSAGPAGAITVDVPIIGVLMMTGEVAYATRGYHRITGPFTETFRSRHMGVALLPRVRIGQGLVRLDLFSGVDLSVPLSSNFDYRGIYTYIMPADDIDWWRTREEMLSTSLETSLVVGGGPSFGSGPVR
jgi:hypothetical protein